MSNHSEETFAFKRRKRWWALIVLCIGILMDVLDGTIVNVALPSIRADLGFSQSSLIWVVNAYLLTFSGFLLLGGRLGDVFGHRRVFLVGTTLFTTASLGCGFARWQGLLIGARAVQGVGGALVSAVALSLAVNLFTAASDRAKAIGICGFVSWGGGSVGLLLGGMLTGALNWHWIFFVNIPIGVAVLAFANVLVPRDDDLAPGGRLDIGGALTMTTALLLSAWAIVNGADEGWTSPNMLVLNGMAAGLLTLFVYIETKVLTPLVPLRLFQKRNLLVSIIAGALLSAAMSGWSFESTLYLQVVLQYSPINVGLAFLPTTITAAIISLSLSTWLVIRFGIKVPLATGLLLAAVGLVLFARAPVDGRFAFDVLPGTLLLGVGCGVASTPMYLAAMSAVVPSESGVTSGVVNTVLIMGSTLGLSILVRVGTARTSSLLAAGASRPNALISGYHSAFLVSAALAVAAAFVAAAFLRFNLSETLKYQIKNGDDPASSNILHD